MFRSVLAVLAGIAMLTVASFALEAVLNPLLLHLFPQALPGPDALSANSWVKALTFTYGFLCVAAGGYATARLAPRVPVKHAAAMGIVQAGLTIMAMLSPVSSHASTLQWIATAIMSVPAALAGGALHGRGASV
jgi:hypothetical protein